MNMCIDDFVLARVLHVIAVMAWIGGVWFVTWVVLPAVEKNSPPDERLAAFHRIEAGFAPIARLWVLLAGVSGLWMVWRADMWARFADPRFWWMLAMVGLWLIFALMLFVLEPLFLHRRMARSNYPAADFARLKIMHQVLSLAGVVTVLGAVGGSHGLF